MRASSSSERKGFVSANLKFVGGCLICLFLVSGCVYAPGPGNYCGIEVHLLSHPDSDITQPYRNITHLDFSAYPTLYHAITVLLDPSTSDPTVSFETSCEEFDRIHSDIGDYFTYSGFFFAIFYIVS
ncbi:MAG: hypothetical protein ACFFC6_00525 [Promethearchaeota archaeon]